MNNKWINVSLSIALVSVGMWAGVLQSQVNAAGKDRSDLKLEVKELRTMYMKDIKETNNLLNEMGKSLVAITTELKHLQPGH